MENNYMYFADMHDQFNEPHINPRVVELIVAIEETQPVAPSGEGPSQVLSTTPQVPGLILKGSEAQSLTPLQFLRLNQT